MIPHTELVLLFVVIILVLKDIPWGKAYELFWGPHDCVGYGGYRVGCELCRQRRERNRLQRKALRNQPLTPEERQTLSRPQTRGRF